MADEIDAHQETEIDEPASAETQGVEFDYVDLMLDGDVKSQVNYSLVKAIAAALDEKVRLLVEAEKKVEGAEGPDVFEEIAFLEIEAMAQAVTDGCVDFGKIHFWEACETAEIAWEETKDEEGVVVNRMPYGKQHDEPKEGNRLLSNLERIAAWLRAAHKTHEEKGMEWVSPYGCPEDGQHAYDGRAKCLSEIDSIIERVKGNFDL
ncbi:MAG: hypothetical protein CMI32_08155 [Opitutales bacterium]|jgi:hypothetical protein|nr:hypothetical protein [Opitutales bacterium]|tara:strand:- start:378 stop:995 length:618 start_codon:yes stop_codon:yes gene_type:complete